MTSLYWHWQSLSIQTTILERKKKSEFKTRCEWWGKQRQVKEQIPSKWAKGQQLGPSDLAAEGLSCTSKNKPEHTNTHTSQQSILAIITHAHWYIPLTPTATAARAMVGTYWRKPPKCQSQSTLNKHRWINNKYTPVLSPKPPGCCTECVQSCTTGAPYHSFMIQHHRRCPPPAALSLSSFFIINQLTSLIATKLRKSTTKSV